MIAQIRATPLNMMCWVEEDFSVACKHLFLITSKSMRTVNLALDHPAWGATPNPWWKFLIDTLLIIEKKSRGVEQAKEAISNAKLGRIRLASLGEEGDRFQGDRFHPT